MEEIKKIEINNFGPIEHAEVEFGDLTILIGAQASGKSLFLQLAKLVNDRAAVIYNLKKLSYILGKNDQKNLMDVYFGQGMSGLWKDSTSVKVNNNDVGKSLDMKVDKGDRLVEKMFYIPAQRILGMVDGRAKSFSEFDPSCPYVLRRFSETLRVFMANGFGVSNTVVFPIKTRLKEFQRKSFDKSIFHGASVEMDVEGIQRKMKLKVDGMDMPFMTWSAGQKEFMPLLMGFYCVSGPPNKVVNKEQYDYVIIEEPEMGLHPQAIKAIIVQILELMQSGYKVIVSTHSSVPVEFAWAFNILKQSVLKGREKALMKLFDKTPASHGWLNGVFDKEIKTYYFTRKDERVTSVDISSLDVSDADLDMSEWGGLTSFASEASEVVAEFCND